MGVVVLFPAVIRSRASVSDKNNVSLKRSSRKLPLKLSMRPFCMSLQGAMQSPTNLLHDLGCNRQRESPNCVAHVAYGADLEPVPSCRF